MNKVVYKFDNGISVKDSFLPTEVLSDILEMLYDCLDDIEGKDALETQFDNPEISNFDRQKKVDE